MTNQKSLTSVDWTRVPAPESDDRADHLPGMRLPSVGLQSTNGDQVDVSVLTGRTILYAYPMTGRPDTPLPDGWDATPGARGCTPQSCSFRDEATALRELGVEQIFGVSVQDSAYQIEAAERLHLPFPLLSDESLAFAKALKLPLLKAHDMTLLARLSLIIDDGQITDCIYPVFPPDQSAQQVIDWLKANRG